MLCSVWGWMASPAGQAAATWGSAILSLVALVVALVALIREQRQAHRQRLEAILSERRRVDQFVVELRKLLTSVQDAISATTPGQPDKPGHVYEVADECLAAVAALRSAIPPDAALAKSYGRTSRTIERVSLFASIADVIGPGVERERADLAKALADEIAALPATAT